MRTIKILLSAVTLALCAGGAGAQESLWSLPQGPTTNVYNNMVPFGDYDLDGVRDLLVQGTTLPQGAGGYTSVISGATGATLWQGPFLPARVPAHAGDVDGDGYPDIVFVGSLVYTYPLEDVAVWSPARGQLLWSRSSPWYASGDILVGGLDVNADGRQDLLVSEIGANGYYLRAHLHDGTLFYRMDLTPLGWGAASAAVMGDMDGDGCDDFVMGCVDPSTRGVMAVVSGRTGAILRTAYGLVPGNQTASHAANIGDVDGDGVPDFVAGSHRTGQHDRITVFSGSTGAVLQSIQTYGDTVIATEDVDLDGIRDVITTAAYQVQFTPPYIYGRTRAFSLRDGSVIWTLDNPTAYIYSNFWGWGAAGLGHVNGNAYPSIAFLDISYAATSGGGYGRIRAHTVNARGQGPVSGSACSSAGPAPKIGVRATANGARVTVSRAQPGGLALLSLALASQTTFGGQPLPLSLAPYGWNGCTMLVGPEAAQMRLVGASGTDLRYAAVDWSVQLVATLGVSVAAQWFVFDPASLTYATTAKHLVRVQ
jgi:hypothetical protein